MMQGGSLRKGKFAKSQTEQELATALEQSLNYRLD